MSTILKNSMAVASVMAITTVAASAATVSSVSIITTGNSGSSQLFDTAIDSTAALTDPAGSIATQNADGTSVVVAEAPSSFEERLITSTAQFEQSETNTFGMSRDYTLSYSLTGQSATFSPSVPMFQDIDEELVGDFDIGFGTVFQVPNAPAQQQLATPVVATQPTNQNNPFLSGDPLSLPTDFNANSAASFEYNISVNGNSIFNARADALLDTFNQNGGLVFDAVDGFTPSGVQEANGNFIFSVGAIEGDIFLGTFADGEAINVVSTLTARSYSPSGFIFQQVEQSLGDIFGVNTGSRDPISLSSLGNLTSAATPSISPVPLPAAGWMLIAGLGGLVAAGRRKS